jgi:hypothetical protein
MFSLSCTRKYAFLMALAASLLATPLLAEEKPAQLKGDWSVSMAKGEKDAFAYCLMRGSYSNGLQLAVALSPKKEVNIGVNVPDAGFKDGEHHPMAIAVDDLIRKEGPGFAPQPDLIMVPVGADSKVLTALRRGKVLSVEGPEDVAHFSLKGTSKALASLQDCVDVGTGKKKAPDPALAGGAPGKGEKKGFPQSLLALLKDAGLKDVEPVAIPDPSKAPIDFGWKTNGIMGGLRERPVPADMTLEKMRDVIEAGYKKECANMFQSSSTPVETLPGVKLSTVDVSCQIGDKVAHVALLIYLTDTKLFSLFMHEGQNELKAKAVEAREAIANAIRKLAREQSGKASPQPAAASPAVPPPAPASAAPTGELKPK